MTTDQWADNAAAEVVAQIDEASDRDFGAAASYAIPNNLAAIIRRHFDEANAGRQGAVDRLYRSLAGAPEGPTDDDFAVRYAEWQSDSCESALAAYRSLPPDPQDAALTAEREALLRRAVSVLVSVMGDWNVFRPGVHLKDEQAVRSVLADAARLGITGDAT